MRLRWAVALAIFCATGVVHCKPRDFGSGTNSKREIRPQAQPNASSFSLAARASARVTFVSFNGKHWGRPKQDLVTVARLLAAAGADLIALQEVNTTRSGTEAVRTLAEEIKNSGGGEHCISFSNVPTEARERYAMLWKRESLAYITTQGQHVDGCPKDPVALPLFDGAEVSVVREPAYGVFEHLVSARKMIAATVHLLPSGKGPQHEVGPVFSALPRAGDPNFHLPIVIMGDFNLSAAHPVFATATALGFTSAMRPGTKTSLRRKRREYNKEYDLAFTRGMRCSPGDRIDVLAQLPTWGAERISEAVSDHVPIRVECDLR